MSNETALLHSLSGKAVWSLALLHPAVRTSHENATAVERRALFSADIAAVADVMRLRTGQGANGAWSYSGIASQIAEPERSVADDLLKPAEEALKGIFSQTVQQSSDPDETSAAIASTSNESLKDEDAPNKTQICKAFRESFTAFALETIEDPGGTCSENEAKERKREVEAVRRRLTPKLDIVAKTYGILEIKRPRVTGHSAEIRPTKRFDEIWMIIECFLQVVEELIAKGAVKPEGETL